MHQGCAVGALSRSHAVIHHEAEDIGKGHQEPTAATWNAAWMPDDGCPVPLKGPSVAGSPALATIPIPMWDPAEPFSSVRLEGH